MRLIHRYDDQKLLVKISGKMNTGDADEFHHRVKTLVVPGVREVEVDMAQIETLATLALARFTLLYHQLSEEDVRLCFVNLSPALAELFEIVNLDMAVDASRSPKLPNIESRRQ